MSKGIALIIFLPVVTSLYAFAVALLLYVVWKLMGSHESYETAFRCLAFIAALTPVTALLGFLPYIGSLISIILYTSFLVITSAEVHLIPTRRHGLSSHYWNDTLLHAREHRVRCEKSRFRFEKSPVGD